MNRRGPYWLNLAKGLDYFLATLVGIPAGIYVSGYVAYKRADTRGGKVWVTLEKTICWLFQDRYHCIRAMAQNLQDIKYYYE